MRRLELEFDVSSETPKRVRRAAQTWSEKLSMSDSAAEDLSLVVSELVTNAVVHARSEGRIVLTLADGRLRIEVYDYEAAAPTIRPDPSADGGFGLRIVAAASDSWGWNTTSTGKMVWAEMTW